MQTAVKDRPSLELGYVYGIKSLELIKVGVAKDVKARLFKIQGSNPHGCQIVFQRLTIAPYIYELKMHELLAEHAIGREWFRVTVDQVRAASKIASAHTKRTYRELDAPYAEIRLAALQERQSAF